MAGSITLRSVLQMLTVLIQERQLLTFLEQLVKAGIKYYASDSKPSRPSK